VWVPEILNTKFRKFWCLGSAGVVKSEVSGAHGRAVQLKAATERIDFSIVPISVIEPPTQRMATAPTLTKAPGSRRSRPCSTQTMWLTFSPSRMPQTY